MKEGVIAEEFEYYKYDDHGNEIVITKDEYDNINENHVPIDDFDIPKTNYRCYKLIRLSIYSCGGIAGILSYDMASNQFALNNGYHPASGFRMSRFHSHNIEQRKHQMSLLGEDPIDVPASLFSERCSNCLKVNKHDNDFETTDP